MENLIGGLLEFLIEMAVVAAFTSLITVLVSVLILRSSGLYKRKAYLIGVVVIVSIAVSASGPENHASLRQWAYYVIPTVAVSLPLVAGFFRKKAVKASQT